MRWCRTYGSVRGAGSNPRPYRDRLMHRAEVVRIEGKSYRQKEADEREAARKSERAARKTPPRSRKDAS